MSRFRTVWRSGLLGAAALLPLAAGCVSGGGDQTFVVDWALVYVGGKEAVECDEAGTPRVELAIRDLQTRTEHLETFDCDRMSGTSKVLPVGRYAVEIRLKDAGGRVISKLPGEFDIYRSGPTDLGTVVFQIQSFLLQWSLSRGGNILTCEQAGGTTVELITQLGNNPPLTYKFPCADRVGATTAIPTGPYTVAVRLVDATGKEIDRKLPMSIAVTDEMRAMLPPAVFEIR